MIRPTLLAALLVLATYLFLSSHLEMTLIRASQPGSHNTSYALPDGPDLAAASLGFTTAAADLVWINAILYTADRIARGRSAENVTEFADAIIHLDPYFYPVYHWHSANRRLLDIRMDYDDVAEANRILKVGTEYFPNDYRLPFSIAVNHLGNRYERTPQERLKDLEEIATYAGRAAELPGASDDILLLATAYQRRLIRARAGLSEFADEDVTASPEELDFLIRRYHNTSDPLTQNFLLHRLHELGAADEALRQAEVHQQKFDLAQRRGPLYLSPDLFILTSTALYTYEDSPSDD